MVFQTIDVPTGFRLYTSLYQLKAPEPPKNDSEIKAKRAATNRLYYMRHKVPSEEDAAYPHIDIKNNESGYVERRGRPYRELDNTELQRRKDKRSERQQCQCGGRFTLPNLQVHNKSKRHQNFISEQIIADL